MIENMTLEHAKRILESHGADPRHWPQNERAELETFLEANAEGKELLESARALDEALGLLEDVPVPVTLKADLMAEAQAVLVGPQAQWQPAGDPGLGWLLEGFKELTGLLKAPALAGFLASVLVVGIWFGTALSSEPLGEDEILTAFGEDYGLWDEEEPGSIDFTGETL